MTAGTMPRPTELRQGAGGTSGALRSEWTKLMSVRSTLWCLIGGVLMMAVFAPSLGISLANLQEMDKVTTKIPIAHPAVLAVNLVQFAAVALAMLAITAEYTSGSIRTTLQCVPSRGRMLFSKTAVIAPAMFVFGAVLAALGTVLTAPLLGKFAGYDTDATAITILNTGIYFALVSAFTIGVGAAIRSSVGTLTVVFMVLAGLPGMLALTSSDATDWVREHLPSSAGLHFMDGDTDPYGRPTALLIVVLWTVVAQLAGYLTLRRRDA